MFGLNERVGQKFFQHTGDQLLVTRIFFTLQGEGPYRGEPAVFVRLAKCQLACSFCDTYFDNGKLLSFDAIWRAVVEISELPLNQVGLVITGGEPTLQGAALSKFMTRRGPGPGELVNLKWVQMETNGLLPNIPPGMTIVCSPKCSEANGMATHYLRPHPDVLADADCLKFVMEDAPTPYREVPDWALAWRDRTGREIFISPMNRYAKQPDRDEVVSFWTPGLLDLEQVQRNHEYASAYCLKTGCTFNMQLHLFAGME